MTKRKAIEAALSVWNKVRRENGFTVVDVEDVIVGAAVEKAYELGRIAGLRYAASCANEPSDAVKYRKWANELARKAKRS